MPEYLNTVKWGGEVRKALRMSCPARHLEVHSVAWSDASYPPDLRFVDAVITAASLSCAAEGRGASSTSLWCQSTRGAHRCASPPFLLSVGGAWEGRFVCPSRGFLCGPQTWHL